VVPDEKLAAIVKASFDFTPKGIIRNLKLRKPIFRKTAAYGHFGRTGFEWEKTNAAGMLRKKAAGLHQAKCACCC
jgi:S-adenosylmethionine synthetase